ncbi:hypothetical protein OROMI_005107 [Orobanche minor]
MALSSKLYVPNNVVHNKRVAWILFFKIRPSQEILKIRDGTHLDSEEILTYIKKALETDRSFQEILKIHDVQNKRAAWILCFKIRPSQEILKIRDGTPLEAEEILTHKKSSRNGSVWHFFNKLDDPSNIVQKERVAWILFFKIRSFQEILKIHDGTPLESEEILTYIKKPPKQVEILKINDGTPLESEEILTYKKKPPKQIGMALSSKLYVPSNVVHKKRVAWILFFKIRPSQEILKIRDSTHLDSEEILTYIKKALETDRSFQEILKIHDGTPLESEEILTYINKPPKQIGMALSSKLYVPNNVVHNKRVAWILFFKIRPSQEILKIRDGTHLDSEEILTYIKKALETDRSFQEILKIHDGTPLESEEILTYIKKPPKQIGMALSSKLYVPNNVVHNKRVAWILFFKIKPSQEILKIRDGTHLDSEEILTYIKKALETDRSFQEILKIHDVQNKRVAWILCFKIRPSQEILKIRDGTPLEAEEILTHKKSSRNGSVWHFFNKLDDPSNIVQKERVAWILFFKIRSFQEILKIHDGTPLESEEILTYIKKPPKQIGMALSSKPSQEILKIRDSTHLDSEEILTYIKKALETDRSFQEILKIHDGTPLESEEILTYINKPPKQIGMALSSKLYVPNNVVHNKRVAWILFFKIRPSQEILKIRDGTHLDSEEILTYIKKALETDRSFQEILKIHDGTPLESEEILTYIKKPPKQIGMALSSKLYVPNNVVHNKRVAWILFFKIKPSQEILKIRDGTHLDSEEILTYIKKALETDRNKRVAWILCFKIRPSQEILKIRDGTPLEAEEILTHKKSSRNGSVWHFFNKLDDPSNIVQKERVAWILFFKIRSFQEILKIHDGTPLESEEILTYIKKPPKQIGMALSSKLYVPSNVVHKKRVAWILFFKIRPSQEILKIRDSTHLDSEEILTYIKKALETDRSFQEILKIHDVQNKRVAWILCFKIRPSQEILKIRDGTPLEAEEILTHKKSSRNGSVWHFFNKLDDPSNIVQKERVARILFFKIRSFQEILKIHDGTPLEAEEILTHKKSSRNGSVWHFFNKLDDPSNIVQKERVARILFFKIISFQEILKIHDGTPLESEEILTYIKKPPKQIVQNKRVAWILCFKIRPSQEILKIRDGTPLEAEEILTHKKSSRNGSVWHFFNKLDDPSNIVQKERVARILFFKIRSFQEILKIHEGTHLESEEILTYIKKPPKQIVIGMALSSKLYVPSNVVHKKRVAWILFFKIRPSQEILKIRDSTHLDSEEILTYIKKALETDRSFQEILKIHDVQNKRVAWILCFKIRPSQEILKIRDGTPLEAEEILTHKKSSRNGSVWHFFNKLDDPSNIVQKERVARILFFKIRSFQEILKIHDGTPLEAEEILTHKKSSRNGSVWHFFNKLDDPSNIVQKERVARILFFKIISFQEILKIHDGTPLESEEILTYIKKPPKQIVQNKRVAWILCFKIRPSQEILKIRDGTPLEAEEILTHKKSSRNGSVWHFFNKLDDPSNIVQKERVARILFFKIRSFQEILKIHEGTHLESEEILTYIKKPPKQIVIGMALSSKLDVPNNVVQNKRVAWILCFKIRPSQEIIKIRDGTPLEAEEILTHKKSSRNGSKILKIHEGTHLESEEILTYKKKPPKQIGMALSSKLYVPSNVVHKKRVGWILFFKIRPSQEILKIRDSTHLDSEEILTYINKPPKQIVAWILCFKIRPSQEILKIRDGTPLEAEEILTHKKSSRNGSVWHFFNKLDDPSNIVQKERVAWILFFKIRSFQEILKIHDGTPLESEEILTYIKKPPKQIGMALSSKLYVPSNVVHKKRVAWILFFKIRPSQEILKIRDSTHLDSEEILTYIKKALETDRSFQEILKIHDVQNKRVAWILCFKIRPSQEILKIRDGTPLEAEEILTHKKSSRNGSVWHFFNKLDDPSNIVQKERVARILFFKIRSFQEILKIHDGTPLEAEEILTHKKSSRNGSVWHFFNKLDDPSNIVQKERVARILFFKIISFQEILKIHDGTPLESEEILTYIKKPLKQIEIIKIRDGTPLEAEEILTHKKNRSFQEILKIHEGTHLESEEILTYKKKPPKQIGMALSSKLYVPSNVVHKKRVGWILFFKIRPSQEILKIRDSTHLDSEEILTYIKKALETDRSFQEILKIHDGTPLEPSQEILKIRDGTPLEAEEILTHKKSSRNGSVWHFFNKLDDPSNIVQKERVARILFFKIRSFQEILKIHDGTPLESEEILTYIKKPPKRIVGRNFDIHKKPPKQIGMALSSKLDVPNNVVQNKRVAWILCFKIRPSQEIIKIRDGTPLEAEEILTHKKVLETDRIGMALSSKLYVPSNVVHKKRVAWILFFKIRPSQEILKIRDSTHLDSEEILTYIKKALETDRSFQEILKIHDDRPSQEILKIRDGTPLEAEEILTHKKSSRNGSVWHFFNKLDDPSNIVQKERVARILFFKIRSFQEILKIHEGTHLESEEILTYIKKPPKQIVIGMALSSKLDVPNNVVQNKRVAWILCFKIRPSQEIIKIRDGTPLEAEEILTHKKVLETDRSFQEILKIHEGTHLESEEILTYKKSPQNRSKRVAWILFFKIRPSQEILKIRDSTHLDSEEILTYIKKALETDRSFQEILKIHDGTPLEKLDVPNNVVQNKRVAWILCFKIRPSQEILKIRDGTPLEAEEILTHKKSSRNGSVWHFFNKLDDPSNIVQKERVARILFFKIRSFQEILKIHEGTHLESEEILTYIKKPPKQIGMIGMALSSKLDVPNNVVQNKRVAWILCFKIRPSQEIIKIRDGTPLEAEEILTYIKKPPKQIVQNKRVARILFFKIRPSQEILKIRYGTPLEAEEILTHKKSSRNGSVWHFFNKLDDPSNIVQKERVARILFFKIRSFQEILKIHDDKLDVPNNAVQNKRVAWILCFKIRPSQEILKIRDGTPLEAEEILTHNKSSRNGSVWHFFNKLDDPSNIVQKERVARILFFKIRSFQEILKINDGTPLESEEILTYIKKPPKQIEILKIRDDRVAWILFFKIRPSQEILKIRDSIHLEAEEILTYIKSSRNGSVWHFFNKLNDPSNIVQKKRVARILFFKIRPSQEILKIRDGTPLESEEILTYIKKPQKQIVAWILFFKIRPSQEILKIRDGTPLEAEEILTHNKSSRNGSVWHFFNKLDDPSNIVQKKRVARILFFKIRSFQEILKIHDGTPLESEEILTYIKKPPKQIGMALYSKFDVPNNVVHKKRVAWILFIKIRPSQEILKIRDVAWILCFKIRPSQEILKIHDGTPLDKLDVPSNIVQKKRVAWILFFKIRPSQEILKIRDSVHLEAEEILTYIKSSRNGSVWHFLNKLNDPSNIVHKKRVARILFFKIRPSQEILKIRDGTPLESEEILTYIKKPQKQIEILKIRDSTHLEAEEILTYIKKLSKRIGMALFNKLNDPSNIVQKKRVAQILFFKIRSFQEILKIHDGTPLESEEILTYIKKPPKQIESFQEILKIHDGTPFELNDPSNIVQKKRVAWILVFKIRPSQEILKIRDGTPLESEEILTYIKSRKNRSVWCFYSKLDVPSNIVQKKRVAWILFFKIRPSQEILKIRDGTPLESEEILTYIKKPQKQIVAWILVFKIRPSQEILKIRDGTPLESEEILTYIKSRKNRSVWCFYSKLDVPSNIVQKKRVAWILFFKIRPSQEILKIRDGTPLESEEILTYIKKPQKQIDIHLEAEEILTYIKSSRNGSVWHFFNKLNDPSNIVQKKRVARILFFKIRPSQETLKIRDVQKKRVAWILFFKIRPSQEILKIRDGTPLEAEEILTHNKSSRNGSVWHFFNKLDDPRNIVQKERVSRILFFKIRSFQEILKIRDSIPLESEEILTYIKSSRNGSVWHFFNKLNDPSNIVQKKRVARILFFKIRPSQEILKIRDGTPLESEEILTYIKKPPKWIEILKIRDGTPLEAEEILTHNKSSRNGSVWHFFNKLDDPSNIVQKERVARILFFKIRSFQEILKINDGTPLESEEILTYIKKPPKQIVAWILVFKIRPSQEILKIRDVAWILFFKIRPSQEILKIRDGTPLEAEEILTYKKSSRNGSVWHFFNKLDDPSNIVQKKRVAWILVFKIRPSQEILKIRDGGIGRNFDIHKKAPKTDRVAWILFFKIRPSQEILKIRDSVHLEAEEILTYIKSSRNGSVWHFLNKLNDPSNIVHKKRVARILFFKIRPSQEILKIRDGTPLESEEILTYIKKPQKQIEILKIRDSTHLEAEEILTYIKKLSKRIGMALFNKLNDPSNIVQKKRVAQILFFKIRSFQEILKIHDGTPLESEEILTYIKKPPKQIESFQEILKIHDGTPFELNDPSNIVQKKRVAWILVFKIRPSQEILKIRDGTPLESEEILTYIKSRKNRSVWCFYSKLDVPSNIVQKKRVAWILFFKIRPSQEILKIRDGTPLESEEILTYIKKPQKQIGMAISRNSKIRDSIHLEAEEILTYIKSSRNGSVWHFFNKLNDPSNIVQKKRVARILFFKIRPSQETLKIRDGTPLESEKILTYIKKPQKQIDRPSQEILKIRDVQKKRVAWILFFKIRPSQEILKIRDGTPLEAEEILTHNKSSRNGSVWHFFNKLDDPRNIVQKERVSRILFFKIRSFQEILKIRDSIPLESEEILTYIKSSRNGSVWHFFNKLNDPSNIVQKKRVARILFFKIRPSQEILKIRDGTPLESEEILTYIKKPPKWIEILKIRDGTPLEAEEILTHNKSSRNGSVWHFFNKLDDPSNIVQKERVARILFFKIRSFQEILKINDGTPLESEEILTYIKKPPKQIEILKIRDDVPSNIVQKKRVAWILFFKIRPSQEILKIRDGTPLEAEEILTYKKSSRNGSVWHFFNKLDDPSNIVQKKRVARILFFKIRSFQEILKIHDGTPFESEEILTYIKKPPKQIVQKKRVAWILVFKIRPSQEILKIRDGTPLESEEILTYIKSRKNRSVWCFYSKLDVPSNIVQKKRVAWILFFKIRPSQEILKIRDGTPLESEEILTYIKKPQKQIDIHLEAEEILTYIKSSRNGSVWHFFNKLNDPSNIVQKKRVARILFFKIRPSQETLKIRDVQKKRVAWILFFKIRPSQEILKIRDGTPLEAEEILTHNKSSRNGSVWHFFNKLDDPSNIVQKERVSRILFFKIRSFQEILKIRDSIPLESEEILTYIKSSRNGSVWHFFNKLNDPSNIVQKKRVARILFFKIRPSQEILKIRDGTPLESEEILTYIKKPPKWIEILKIRDGTPLEAEEILTHNKSSRNGSVWHFFNKLDDPSNIVQKERVARILFFKIRSFQEILKINDGTPLESEEILTYIKKPPKQIE